MNQFALKLMMHRMILYYLLNRNMKKLGSFFKGKHNILFLNIATVGCAYHLLSILLFLGGAIMGDAFK
jgi:hypothetical protein